MSSSSPLLLSPRRKKTRQAKEKVQSKDKETIMVESAEVPAFVVFI